MRNEAWPSQVSVDKAILSVWDRMSIEGPSAPRGVCGCSEVDCAGRRGGDVDQRLDGEERADRDDQADDHAAGKDELTRRGSTGRGELQLRRLAEVHRPHHPEVVVGGD